MTDKYYDLLIDNGDDPVHDPPEFPHIWISGKGCLLSDSGRLPGRACER